MLKPEHYKYIKGIQHWADQFYKIKTGKSQIKQDSDESYNGYLKAVGTVYDKYEELKMKQ